MAKNNFKFALKYYFCIDNNGAKCEHCFIHKTRINEIQEKLNEADKRLQSMDKLKDEHDKETIYRKQMEEKWNEKLEEHKTKANINILIINFDYFSNN